MLTHVMKYDTRNGHLLKPRVLLLVYAALQFYCLTQLPEELALQNNSGIYDSRVSLYGAVVANRSHIHRRLTKD